MRPLTCAGRCAGFPADSWPARLLLLQTAILERFSFVRVRGERPGPPLQFVHSHGHCFVQVGEPECGPDGDPLKVSPTGRQGYVQMDGCLHVSSKGKFLSWKNESSKF